MAVLVFSSTGCIRCNIVKNFLKDREIDYVDYDIKTEEGDENFKRFYRENRKNVRRDSKGIFFPVVALEDGSIVQDAGSTLSRLIAGETLNAVITPNQLGHGWTGGIDISAGKIPDIDSFLQVLDLMKKGGLAVETATSGLNSQALERAIKSRLIDRLIFNVPWSEESRTGTQGEELANSLKAALAATVNVEVHYITDITLDATPALLAETARFMNEVTETNRLPYKLFSSDKNNPNLFPYRTSARRWQVLTDIKK